MKPGKTIGLVAALVLGGSLAAAPAIAGTLQISGDAAYDTTGVCPLVEGYDSYPPLVVSGDLDGCWYTHIEFVKVTNSGVYLETGRELFVGSVDGGPLGTFTTTYRFEAKYAPDGSEIIGRCQHPLVAGSGTGGFLGARGHVDFKDIVENDPVTYEYQGHIA